MRVVGACVGVCRHALTAYTAYYVQLRTSKYVTELYLLVVGGATYNPPVDLQPNNNNNKVLLVTFMRGIEFNKTLLENIV